MPALLGCIADDLTGGTDLAGILVKNGMRTEQMIGVPGTPTRNELVLTPQPGGRTLIEVRIEYPSKELRDTVLGTGMVDGMEASYARMESVALAA